MITDFKNKKITMMGLGLHGGGEGLVRYLVENGAKVCVTDLKSKDQLIPTIQKLADLEIQYSLGGHKWSDFSDADTVFINPGVPKKSLWLKKIKKARIPINTEMNLFFELCKGQIIGVTGTNGKSTTSTLIYKIFKKAFKESTNQIFFGGNIGGSLLGQLNQIEPDDIVILELSSFQLQDLSQIQKSPHVSVLLNIAPDHLDIHESFEEYIEAKKNIFRFQKNSDFAVLNYDDEYIKKIAKTIISRKFFFSRKIQLSSGVYIENEKIFYKWRGISDKIASTKKIKIIGKHNLENVLAAICCAIIFNIKAKKIGRVVYKFKGLEHRIEFVKEIGGVEYYNDSKATTPESTIAALLAFNKNVILLAGGSEKKVDFGKLAKSAVNRTKAVILFGQTKDKIRQEIIKKLKSTSGRQTPLVQKNIYLVNNIYEAMNLAEKISHKDNVILLSPACASFDQFSSYEERGRIFKQLI